MVNIANPDNFGGLIGTLFGNLLPGDIKFITTVKIPNALMSGFDPKILNCELETFLMSRSWPVDLGGNGGPIQTGFLPSLVVDSFKSKAWIELDKKPLLVASELCPVQQVPLTIVDAETQEGDREVCGIEVLPGDTLDLGFFVNNGILSVSINSTGGASCVVKFLGMVDGWSEYWSLRLVPGPRSIGMSSPSSCYSVFTTTQYCEPGDPPSPNYIYNFTEDEVQNIIFKPKNETSINGTKAQSIWEDIPKFINENVIVVILFGPVSGAICMWGLIFCRLVNRHGRQQGWNQEMQPVGRIRPNQDALDAQPGGNNGPAGQEAAGASSGFQDEKRHLTSQRVELSSSLDFLVEGEEDPYNSNHSLNSTGATEGSNFSQELEAGSAV